MRKIVSALLKNYIGGASKNEGFSNFHGKVPDFSKKDAWIVVLSFIIVELILLVIGKFLWNKIVIDIIPGLRRINSIWQLLGLSILIKLLTN